MKNVGMAVLLIGLGVLGVRTDAHAGWLAGVGWLLACAAGNGLRQRPSQNREASTEGHRLSRGH